MTRNPFIDIVAAAAFLAVALAAYGAWYHVVGNTSAEAASLRSQVEERGAAGGRAAAARKALGELSGQESAVYGHLVSSADVVPFLETIQATGKRLGATVEVASVGDAAGKPNQITLALRISGTFDSVMRTLGALEYQRYDAVLSSLSIESQGASVGTWEAAASFNVGKVPPGIRLAPAPAVPVPQPAPSTATSSPHTP